MVTSTRGLSARVSQVRDSLRLLSQVGLLAAMRPDKYVRIAAALRREGITSTSGIAMSARRCPTRPGFVDELGTLTYRELDQRANALAAALQQLTVDSPSSVGILCRNHRGFLDALAATDRIGADVLLLNTAFAGPALTEVIGRERPDVVIYDEEFAASVDEALADNPGTQRIMAWTESDGGTLTVEKMIAQYAHKRPHPTGRTGKLILLTSGTTGTPKGAKRSGGGVGELIAVLSRIPWRAEEAVVVAAPMFHAWGYGQLLTGLLLSCTVVTRRKFDPEATLALVDRHRAAGLGVVPVMIDRIVELPDDVRNRYNGRSLRFVTASGSRMRSDTLIQFMDEFGEVVYNNYNATEVGMIATATPQDLRAAPDTAGKPMAGVDIRILDDARRELPTGEIGQIFARSTSHFDEYTSGTTKEFHGGYMASGDVGYFDDAGRLFVVGRDDDMIVSGGENVYPVEVEKTLTTHPDVAEVCVLGVEDDKYGQRLTGFVVLKPGAQTNADALKQHVRERLANYKVPREITILDELPRTSTGKVHRKGLVDRVRSTTEQ